MLSLTPRQLAYISIILAVVVLVMTVIMIVFPKLINEWDEKLVFKKKKKKVLMHLAYFLNYAITPMSVSIFYIIMAIILSWNEEYRILGIGISSIIMVSIAFRSLKRITQRQRPKDAKIHFKDYSFPSWHTWAWFVFFLSLALALTWMLEIRYYERVFLLAIVGWIIIARSRWYIKVHRVSDVIVWSLLWIWCFIFSYLLFFYFWDAIIHAVEQVFFSL